MKAFLIDPFNQAVTEVDYNGDYRQIYEHIQANCFAAPMINDKEDVVFVDDEGLFKENQAFFKLDGYPQPLAGRGLVLGTNKEGESIEPTITLEELERQLAWVVGKAPGSSTLLTVRARP